MCFERKNHAEEIKSICRFLFEPVSFPHKTVSVFVRLFPHNENDFIEAKKPDECVDFPKQDLTVDSALCERSF